MPKPTRVYLAMLIVHLEISLHPLDRMEKLLENPGEHADTIQLHTSQCKFLVRKLFKIKEFFMNTRFFDFWEVDLMPDNLVNAMDQMHSVLQRGEDLVKVCCYKGPSWLSLGTVFIIDIKEDIIDILLELQTWVGMVIVGIAQTRGIVGDQVSELELLREAEEEYESLLETFRSNSELDEAALEDKKNLLEKLQIVQELCLGNGLFHTAHCLLAVYMSFRLKSGNFHQDDFDVIKVLKKYKINKPIGSGSFGTVVEVTWLNIPCALKIGDAGTAEGTNLQSLHHPNIIQNFYHWEAQDEDDHTHMRSYMLMELMSMDLTQLIVTEKMKKKSMKILTMSEEQTSTMPFQLNVAVDIMLQVAKAMGHLHDNKVIHRDLKPSNILVNPCKYGVKKTLFSPRLWDIKIADFGLCKRHDDSNSSQTLAKGTPRYAAPEMFCREGLSSSTVKIDPKAADVWSFGMTSSEILSGKVPFENESGDDLHAKILRDPTLRPALPSTCPQYLQFVLTSCWKQEPQERPSFRDILRMLRYARLISLGMIQLENCCSVFSYTTRKGCNIRLSTPDEVPLYPSARPPKKISLSRRLIAKILTSQGHMGGGSSKKFNNQKVSSIPQLVQNLKSVLVEEWKPAVQEIWWLAEKSDNHPRLVAAGAIPLLLSSLSTNAPEVQEAVLRSLNALLTMKEIVNINVKKTFHYLVKVLKYGNDGSLEFASNIISRILDSQSSEDLDFYMVLDKSGVIATFKELSIYGSPLQQRFANIALPRFLSFEDLDNLYDMQMFSRWELGDYTSDSNDMFSRWELGDSTSDSNDMNSDGYSRHAAINVGSTYPIVQALRNVLDRGQVVSDYLEQVFSEPCMDECFGFDWQLLPPPSYLDYNGMPLDEYFKIFKSYIAQIS